MKHEAIALEAAATKAETVSGLARFLARLESGLEKFLFASRWLMAPFYVLMVGSLAMLLVKFTQETWHIATHALSMTESDAVLAVLSLIDITLTGNLMMMVLFAGYENFVSKMDVKDHEDRPEWMGKVDFSGLKLKLIASIVAISGINLLKNFMSLDGATMTPGREQQLFWMVAIHMVFIASGVMLAVMDKIVSGTPKH
jgi:uncharacterized protein (TIGR00645 family)